MKKSLIALVISVLLYPVSGLAGDWALFCYKTDRISKDGIFAYVRFRYLTIGDYLRQGPSLTEKNTKLFTLTSTPPAVRMFKDVADRTGKAFTNFDGNVKTKPDGTTYVEVAGYNSTAEARNVFLLYTKEDAEDFCNQLENACAAQSVSKVQFETMCPGGRCTRENLKYQYVAAATYGHGPYEIGVRYVDDNKGLIFPLPSKLHFCPFNYVPDGTEYE